MIIQCPTFGGGWTWLMKPYPIRYMAKEQRIFNYRLPRARRVVENAFGILAHRFRCLLTTMQQHPHRVERIVMSYCVMHILLSIRYPRQSAQMMDMEDPHTHEVLPGTWRDEETLLTLQTQRGNTSSKVEKFRGTTSRIITTPPLARSHGRTTWYKV